MQENQSNLINQTVLASNDKYVPSSVEKKRAVVMYFLFGILVMLNRAEMNVFEFYHLRQAVGWRISLIILFIFSGVLWFIPIIKYLGSLPLLFMVVMLVIFLNEAWNGKYQGDKEKSNPLMFFSGLGGWLLNLFEINPKVNIGNENTESGYDLIKGDRLVDIKNENGELKGVDENLNSIKQVDENQDSVKQNDNINK